MTETATLQRLLEQTRSEAAGPRDTDGHLESYESNSGSSKVFAAALEAAAGVQGILVCDSQPLTIEGVRSLLRTCGDLKLVAAASSLANALSVAQEKEPRVILVDKAFGVPALMAWISEVRRDRRAAVVVWGVSMNEAEALRLVQAGAQGVIRKSADPSTLLECLRSVVSGGTWMEDSLVQGSDRPGRNPRSNLTPREQQVVELVEQGMKNKEIAREMGIRPGTVKIHLKHIFEKTGVRGRFGLALSGLREKGFLSYPQQ